MNRNLTKQDIKGEITAWGNRAEMARKREMPSLVDEALRHQKEWQKRLDELEETDQEGPLSPSGVPRKPRPKAGGSNVALPLPEPGKDD